MNMILILWRIMMMNKVYIVNHRWYNSEFDNFFNDFEVFKDFDDAKKNFDESKYNVLFDWQCEVADFEIISDCPKIFEIRDDGDNSYDFIAIYEKEVK